MYGLPDTITATAVKRGASKMTRTSRGAEKVSDAEAFYFMFLVYADFFMSIFRGIAWVVRIVARIVARTYNAVANFIHRRLEARDRKARAKRK